MSTFGVSTVLIVSHFHSKIDTLYFSAISVDKSNTKSHYAFLDLCVDYLIIQTDLFSLSLSVPGLVLNIW